jgi:hypothetical protein
MLLCAGLVLSAAWWFYTSRQPKLVLPSGDQGAQYARIAQLQTQLAAVSVNESPDSLRRRTMKIADELSKFLTMRQQNHPPNAYPDSRDPNPSEERKAAIKKCQDYDQQTQDLYARIYRDRLVGIIREYHVKGIATGFLESSAMQRVPYAAIPGSIIEGTPNDELWMLRNLAYRVDAKDNSVVIPE